MASDRFLLKYYEEQGRDGTYENPYINEKPWWYPMTLRMLKRYQKTGGWALDVGTGSGKLALEMANRSMRVIGFDLSRTKIKRCHLFYKEKNLDLTFLVADAKYLPFQENVFEDVLCSMILEHLSNPEKALIEIYRVAKNHAIIVTQCPSREIQRECKEAFANRWDGHISLMMRKELFKLIKKYNFEIIEWKRLIIFRDAHKEDTLLNRFLARIDILLGYTPLKFLPAGFWDTFVVCKVKK